MSNNEFYGCFTKIINKEEIIETNSFMNELISENNNSTTDFKQIWSNYIFVDDIPEIAPNYKDYPFSQHFNKNSTNYLVYDIQFLDESKNEKRSILNYIENYQLVKEFRQKNVFKFDNDFDEEVIRNIIIPGTTKDRSYTPVFYTIVSGEKKEIPYLNLNPIWDLKNCRLTTVLELDNLYFSGWIYKGLKLNEFSNLPFNDELYILKNKNNIKASLRVTAKEDKFYNLPDSKLDIVNSDSTIVTHETINQVLNNIGDLDGGRYW